jgi:PAS domain S-box-containing protein
MPKLVLRLRALPTGTLRDSGPPNVIDLGSRSRSAPAPTQEPTPLARWSSVVATASDPCLLLDAQGRVVTLSAAAGELLGCGTEGVSGRPFLPLIDLLDFDTGASSPDYAQRVAPVAVLLPGVGLVRSLLRLRHPDGAVRTVDAAGSPVHDDAGRLIGSITLFSPLGASPAASQDAAGLQRRDDRDDGERGGGGTPYPFERNHAQECATADDGQRRDDP